MLDQETPEVSVTQNLDVASVPAATEKKQELGFDPKSAWNVDALNPTEEMLSDVPSHVRQVVEGRLRTIVTGVNSRIQEVSYPDLGKQILDERGGALAFDILNKNKPSDYPPKEPPAELTEADRVVLDKVQQQLGATLVGEDGSNEQMGRRLFKTNSMFVSQSTVVFLKANEIFFSAILMFKITNTLLCSSSRINAKTSSAGEGSAV
jgi:hypothetical protein